MIEWTQIIVSAITVVALFITARLQYRTLTLSSIELREKLMPAFQLKSKEEGLFLVTINATAYNVRFEAIGSVDVLSDPKRIKDWIPMIPAGEIPNQLDFDFTRRYFVKSRIPTGETHDFLKITYEDFNGIKYYQTVFFLNNWIFVSRPREM